MKNSLFVFSTCLFFTASFLLSGCVKDACRQKHNYTFFEPIYRAKPQVVINIKSNPAQEIKDPGKIVMLGNYIFLNEIDKGIHVIDNTDHSSPKNIAFINIPGNIDLAVKGNTLYADFYTDLVVLDISNPLNVVKSKVVSDVFPNRSYDKNFILNDGQVIVDWVKHDTVINEDCTFRGGPVLFPGGVLLTDAGSKSGSATSAPTGISGSMARFALVNNYMYIVDDSYLNVFDISSANNPVFLNKAEVDWHVETIYPFKNNLFIGSNNGMFIFDILSAPSAPFKVGEFTHARACDPVIADDSTAFITLHSGTDCLGFNNELDIVKLNNLTDAQLLKTYNLTSPHGLSKDGDLLFICDGVDGLKIYDASDVQNLKLIKQFINLETYDVIANNKTVLVVAKDGLYQYDYSDINNIHLISKIDIAKS